MNGSLRTGWPVFVAKVIFPLGGTGTDFLRRFETPNLLLSVRRGVFRGAVFGIGTLPWEKLDNDQLFLGLVDRSVRTREGFTRSDVVLR